MYGSGLEGRCVYDRGGRGGCLLDTNTEQVGVRSYERPATTADAQARSNAGQMRNYDAAVEQETRSLPVRDAVVPRGASFYKVFEHNRNFVQGTILGISILSRAHTLRERAVIKVTRQGI